MLTILSAIQKSTDYLDRKGIKSARMNAELLLADILGCKRLDLYLSYDRPLGENETNQYRDYIARRGRFEPLQYITGKVEFYDLNLKVNQHVLIPRQETEILIEEIINRFKDDNISSILDIGTGSGNIPIALAKNLTGVRITSIDNSEEAVNLAMENSIINEVESKVEFKVADFFHYIPENKFDLIISNPPYVSVEEYKSLQKEIVDYEPVSAVTDNADGYRFYSYIISKSSDLLTGNGKLAFELAKGQSKKVEELLLNNGFTNISIVKDYQEIDRVIIGELG